MLLGCRVGRKATWVGQERTWVKMGWHQDFLFCRVCSSAAHEPKPKPLPKPKPKPKSKPKPKAMNVNMHKAPEIRITRL